MVLADPVILKRYIQPLVLNVIAEIRADDMINLNQLTTSHLRWEVVLILIGTALSCFRSRDLDRFCVGLNIHDDGDEERGSCDEHTKDASRPKPDADPQPI